MFDVSADPTATHDGLSVLLVEDTDDDAALVARALRQAHLTPTIVRVQTAEDFQKALEAHPDIVISDHSLPQFSSTAALACLRAKGIDIPFIVVSGAIDEEVAVAILKAGAHDFVMKQNLARLGPAVKRELQEARNRSEHRRAQLDLRIQRDFLRLVIDTNPNLIFAKNKGGTFTLANRAIAEVYGTTVEELVGRTDADFERCDGGVGAFVGGGLEIITSGESRVLPCELLMDASTGELRSFEMRLAPLVLPDGLPQMLGIGTDITDRRIAAEALRASEEQFRQAQKMEAVGQLAGGIAHDFNNLLTVVLGYADLLLGQVQGQSDVVRKVEQIRRAGERAGSLTHQLLAFSRKQVLHPKVLDLNHVVRAVETMLRRVIGEDIHLTITVAPALHPVKADPGQMEQVLLNLALNARDAMPLGGTLTIETANARRCPDLSASSDGTTLVGCVSLTVSDTGSGMTSEVQKRIFEPFFTTKAPGKGSGLGLSMIYGVVTQSAGAITVQSECGVGTSITLHFPATDEPVRSTAAEAQLVRDLAGTETILLVEDDTSVRELVRKILTGYGYQVLEASDTTDALQISQRVPGPIHLLLTDIVMPHMSGPELARQLVPFRRDMSVLYMSGFGNHPSLELGSGKPAVAVLHKPFSPDQLGQRVRESLNRARAG